MARNGKQGRKAHPRLIDRLAEQVESELDEWLAPLRRARDAQRAITVGSGDSAHIEMVDDLTTQLAATREVLDRLCGRPKQTQEITGGDGGPLEINTPSVDERRLEVARILHDATG